MEECFQQGKGQAGLDGHQLCLWHSFHRHTVLSMCALALLAIAAARPAAAAPLPSPRATAAADGIPASASTPPRDWADTGALPSRADEIPPAEIGMVKVSVPEARRLLRLAATPMRHTEQALHQSWSQWRRHHQARSRWHHYQAQLRAAPA